MNHMMLANQQALINERRRVLEPMTSQESFSARSWETSSAESGHRHLLKSSQTSGTLDSDADALDSGGSRFFDLPAEVRQMIYCYLYSSHSIVLRYYWEEEYSSGNWHPESTKRKTITGLPSTLLHRVSRRFACDAEMIRLAQTSNFTINNEGNYMRSIVDFTFKDDYVDIRSRLVHFNYVSESNDAVAPWSKLVESCPLLRIVDVTIITYEPLNAKERSLFTSEEQYARSLVFKMMKQSNAETWELEDLQLSQLASILENTGRKNCSVTGSSFKVGIAHSERNNQLARRFYECVSSARLLLLARSSSKF